MFWKEKFLTGSNKGGYSFVELVLAVALAAGILISLSAYLNIVDIEKKSESMRSVNDNLSFAMETISKEIRMGTNFTVSNLVANPWSWGTCGTTLSFINSAGIPVTYRLNSNRIEKATSTNPYLAVTGADLQITKLLFWVDGVGADGVQPRVSVLINGSSGVKAKAQTNINLQTTISQRKVDN